ncbi:MAG TPA: hypothetical protein VMI06_15610 [Terriglobia bacterium]|nr:hypothetical protein [Terriglobia bacterium]
MSVEPEVKAADLRNARPRYKLDGEKMQMKKLLIVPTLALALTLTACSTSWIQTAEQYITVLTPAIGDVAGIIALAGATGASTTGNTVFTYAEQAISDLQTISTLLGQYSSANATTTAQKIDAAANGAKQNLNLILPALHVTDANTVSKVTAAVNLAVNTIAELQALVPASSTTPTLAHLGKPPKPGDLQNQFNQIFAK